MQSVSCSNHIPWEKPYDAGIFLCRDASVPSQVFQNPNAAYLATPSGVGGAVIHSALNIGLENSRRFRALPVYAVLLSEGRQGIAAMVARMVTVARKIAAFVRASEHYEWLPDEGASLENSFMIVLFRAKDPALNEVLVDRINATRKMFVSGTKWKGQKACRIAVSNWRADVEKDLPIVQEVLTSVAQP
jgi:glutamate/tyrosine decarboxylase-like PLP-dependent enzyme